MRRILKRRPSPSMVVAFIALIVAMGGTGYAAITLPKNSVGTAQLKKNAVTTKKIKNGAVRSSKVKNGSLLSADFKAGQLPAGPQGPQGPKGDKGDTGPAGPFPGTLPSGKTVRGVFLAEGQATSAGAFIGDSISFGFTFASKPTQHFINVGDPVPSGCSGSATDPGADPGHICAFEVEHMNVNDAVSEVWSPPANNANDSATFGAGVFTTSAAAGNYEFGGSWAATSP